MPAVVEIRSYVIKEGMADHFGQLMREQSLPLLAAYEMDVLVFRQCLHAPHAYVLMRTFGSVAQLIESQGRFYGSAAWQHGPRQAVLACIDSYTSVVVDADDNLLAALRQQ